MPEADPDLSAADLPRVLSTLVLADGRLRASKPGGLAAAPPSIRQDIDDDAVPIRSPLPARLLNAAVWTVRLPRRLDRNARMRLTREHVESYYENEWIHIPRHALAGGGREWRTPLEAARTAHAGDEIARAKLAAVVLFREQLEAQTRHGRALRRLPLRSTPAPARTPPRNPDMVNPEDVSSMNRDELAASIRTRSILPS